LFTNKRTTWEPINPAPPVMMMFFIRVVLVDYETMNLKSKSCC